MVTSSGEEPVLEQDIQARSLARDSASRAAPGAVVPSRNRCWTTARRCSTVAAVASYFILATVAAAVTHFGFERRLVHASALPRRVTLALRGLLAANVLALPGTLVLCLRARATWAGWSVPLARAAFLDEGFCLLLAASLL